MPRELTVDEYIEASAEFARPLLTWLRARVHAACPGVEETTRWSMLAFFHQGKPLASMAAFKAHVSFGFWHREELRTGLEGAGMGQYGRIALAADLPDLETIEGQIREAISLTEAGVKPKRVVRRSEGEAAVPPELAEALANDDLASTVFDGFSPSARRDYCEWIDEAKRPETKALRVAEAVAWIGEGKRRHWRYER